MDARAPWVVPVRVLARSNGRAGAGAVEAVGARLHLEARTASSPVGDLVALVAEGEGPPALAGLVRARGTVEAAVAELLADLEPPGRPARALAASVRVRAGRPVRLARLLEGLRDRSAGGDGRVPVLLPGSAFALAVAAALLDVPPGTTITYGALAEAAGAPGAARAVGSVMARNPVPLVVPCHRVVPAGGGPRGRAGGGPRAGAGLGAYGWGTDVKRRLLEAEGWHDDA